MRLKEALALPDKGGTVCLVGAGGKTSLMTALARELSAEGPGVLITTTTHIMAPAAGECDALLTDCRADTLAAALSSRRVVCAAAPSPDGKLMRLPRPILEAAAKQARWVIVEADGARRLPAKAPAGHEPQIFEPCHAVIAVTGLGALGKPLAQICHRPALACALLGVSCNTPATPLLLARLITSAQGQFKQVKSAGRFRVLLNQADTPRLAALGEETAGHILALLPGCRVVVGTLRPDVSVKGVFDAGFN